MTPTSVYTKNQRFWLAYGGTDRITYNQTMGSTRSILILTVLLLVGFEGMGRPLLAEDQAAASQAELLDAVNRGETERVRELIAAGVDVVGLNLACQRGHLEIVKLLVQAGADPEGPGGVEQSPLFYALKTYGNPEIVEFLLDAGVELKPGKYARSWLDRSLLMENPKFFLALLEPGVIPDLIYDPGWLKELRREGDIELLKALNYPKFREDDAAAVCLAVVRQDAVLLKKLIQIKAPTGNCPEMYNYAVESYHSPLDVASRLKSTEVFRVLIEAAVPDYIPYYRRYLQRAVGGGQFDRVEMLLAARDSPDKEELATAALGNTLGRGDLRMVHTLLRAGARAEGCELLWRAIREKRDDIAEQFLDAGADPFAEHKGETCFDYMMKKGSLRIFEAALRRVDPERIHPGLLATCDLTRLNILFAAGADPNASDPDHEPALLSIAQCQNSDVLDRMLAEGADIDIRSATGETPLLHLARENRSVLARRLLERGADPNATDVLGNTLLIKALQRQADPQGEEWWGQSQGEQSRRQRLEIVQLLMDFGVDLNIQNSQGRTALMNAASHGYWGLVERLLTAGADESLTDRHGHRAWWHYARASSLPRVTGTEAYRARFRMHLPIDISTDVTSHAIEVIHQESPELAQQIVAAYISKPEWASIEILREPVFRSQRIMDDFSSVKDKFERIELRELDERKILVGFNQEKEAHHWTAFVPIRPSSIWVTVSGPAVDDRRLEWALLGLVDSIRVPRPWGAKDEIAHFVRRHKVELSMRPWVVSAMTSPWFVPFILVALVGMLAVFLFRKRM